MNITENSVVIIHTHKIDGNDELLSQITRLLQYHAKNKGLTNVTFLWNDDMDFDIENLAEDDMLRVGWIKAEKAEDYVKHMKKYGKMPENVSHVDENGQL